MAMKMTPGPQSGTLATSSMRWSVPARFQATPSCTSLDLQLGFIRLPPSISSRFKSCEAGECAVRAEDRFGAQTVDSSKLCKGSASKTAVLVPNEPEQNCALSGTPFPVTPLAHCRSAGSRSDAPACSRALETSTQTETTESSVAWRALIPPFRITL